MTSVAFQGNAVSFGARRSNSSAPQPSPISLDGGSDEVSFAGERSAGKSNTSSSILGCIAGCCGIPLVLGILACVGLRFAFRGKAPAA